MIESGVQGTGTNRDASTSPRYLCNINEILVECQEVIKTLNEFCYFMRKLDTNRVRKNELANVYKIAPLK